MEPTGGCCLVCFFTLEDSSKKFSSRFFLLSITADSHEVSLFKLACERNHFHVMELTYLNIFLAFARTTLNIYLTSARTMLTGDYGSAHINHLCNAILRLSSLVL